jgi:hypothetical protein
MKRSWEIRRQVQILPDAQIRWDRAYQFLLQWSNASDLKDPVQNSDDKEVSDEHSDLCPCLYQSTSSQSDH